MATSKRAVTKKSGTTKSPPAKSAAKRPAARASKVHATSARGPSIIYVHGIGDKPAPDTLKREWDLALFGREMEARTRMAYWADILHTPAATAAGSSPRSARDAAIIDPSALLAAVGVDPENEEAQRLADALLGAMGVRPTASRTRVLPLPAFLRKPIARKFLEALVKDSAAYFFKDAIRKRIQKRLQDVLPDDDTPVVIVSHSQGTVVTLEVLAARARAGRPVNVEHLFTLGSPLGVREVQDVLACPLEVPAGVLRWSNYADPLDPVALDKGIGNDFDRSELIVDELIMNADVRRLDGFNPHSAVGYLAHPKVRRTVQEAARVDIHARFLMARDVAAELAVEQRHSVLIEILEPGYCAVGEPLDATRKHEREHGATDLRSRIARAADEIRSIVAGIAAQSLPKAGVAAEVELARVDPLRRFVAARLTPVELAEVAKRHRDLRVYAIWKSTRKRKLLHRSARVVQADAAWASYRALGEQIRWAVLDTGVRSDHPHFRTHGNIVQVWDCTHVGPPRALDSDRDPDGHGSHVAGIIAGEAPADIAAKNPERTPPRGIAPKARLVVYKVLDASGSGEDAWIIKALDHIAEQNEGSSDALVHGLNLSLGGAYDSTVYGCGFSPICAELRRLWRAGVLVVVAAGNEGRVEVSTPDGELDLNSPMSIGDPANLDDCIAVGSVNADKPHLYGISAFSSRGPTSDGRIKPDVVAPGERISSCDSRYRESTLDDLYRQESGTSMAAPHVSGMLAAFLSVRPEFRGRPDEVKALLLRTCIDLGRDRHHQGHGLPNLMRMLLEA
jgi:hypothetical protein